MKGKEYIHSEDDLIIYQEGSDKKVNDNPVVLAEPNGFTSISIDSNEFDQLAITWCLNRELFDGIRIPTD
ncbi:hypothetical protein [Colwellia sp. Bg11-28]|uniref:hypothetical protein n=1 Tax=Colwellia sp. Bg11-28 TaxID=2058305 RepID=UPI000C340280|nr:hypothetical protein [Colwellia sp. Bg11-28]PKH89521.1 hypothetical protein CXF79_01715 [Colwellia sp. Bg11-28]